MKRFFMVYKQFIAVFSFGHMINWKSIKLKPYHKRRQKVRACIRRRTSWYRAPFGWGKLVVVPSMDLQRKCTPVSGSCKNNTELNIIWTISIEFFIQITVWNYSDHYWSPKSDAVNMLCDMKIKSYLFNQ